MTIFRMTIAAVFLVFALAACGQSGPLFLPGNPSEVQVPASQQQPERAETEEDNEEEEDDDGG
ncbi:MAG: lipoprotein [Woeseiaceae bacterium]